MKSESKEILLNCPKQKNLRIKLKSLKHTNIIFVPRLFKNIYDCPELENQIKLSVKFTIQQCGLF